MGFIDKAKEQVKVAGDLAKDAAKKGQAKVDEVQAKVQAEGIFKELGRATWLESVGRGTDETAAQIESAKQRLTEWEAEHGELS